jgi:hypothetical protein
MGTFTYAHLNDWRSELSDRGGHRISDRGRERSREGKGREERQDDGGTHDGDG